MVCPTTEEQLDACDSQRRWYHQRTYSHLKFPRVPPNMVGFGASSNLEHVSKTRRPFLEREFSAIRSEADRVVPAAQHQQVESLGIG